MLLTSFRFLKSLIAPPFCIACKQFAQQELVLCDGCVAQIRPIVSQTIELTETKRVPVYAIGAYDWPLVPLILAKSYGNRTTAHQLGQLAWDYSVVRYARYDYIVPIPLHWSRYAWRGYNQADMMAQVIAERSGKPMVHLLKRQRATKYQSLFRGSQRIANVADIFQLQITNPEQYRDRHILLVDDVMTSGATIKEAAKLLYTLKPASISALVIARAG